jgi:precorrin-4 C11-methyltransferase
MFMRAGPVYFIGAGPGAPDLITVRGQELLARADLVIYAGSLVQQEILQGVPAQATKVSSAGLKLDEQVRMMEQAVRQGKTVVRLHTGDPSVYSATAEQFKALNERGIEYRVVPGVSSAFAAAAALGIELTLPEVTQSVILTRLAGQTKVPESEALASLAAHRSSLLIFLSVGMVDRVVDELREAGYPEDTPVAVVYRVTWPDEQVIRGSLGEVVDLIRKAEITHHALIVVSPALGETASQEGIPESHLYGPGQVQPDREDTIAILSLTSRGTEIGMRLIEGFKGSTLYSPQRFLTGEEDPVRVIPTITSIRQTLQSAFQRHTALVCIMASGIVVREIAPLVVSKHVDPAVVVIDEAGRYAISLLSGHKGGANQLAQRCAQVLGGQAVVTTASDVQGLPTLDLLAGQYGWEMEPGGPLTTLSAALVNADEVHIYQDAGARDWLPQPLPEHLILHESLDGPLSVKPEYSIYITYRDVRRQVEKAARHFMLLHPRCLHVGIGCNRGTPLEEIEQAIRSVCKEFNLAEASMASIATIDLKADEPGLSAYADLKQLPVKYFSADELGEVEDLPNPSAYALEHVGAAGVAEPAAALAAGVTDWLVEKQTFTNVTVAVSLERWTG